MKAIRIDAVGIVEPIKLAGDATVRRCRLRNDVDGVLAIARLDGFSLVFSRESEARERPARNRVATLVAAWASPCGASRPYFGDVVLTGDGDGGDLPPSVGEYLRLVAGPPALPRRGQVYA